MRENILIDFDGTLFDTGRGVKESFVYALKHFGIQPGNPALLDRVMGPPLSDSFTEFYGLNKENVKEAVNIYRDHYEKSGLFSSQPYEGIEEFIESVKRSGKRLFIASSKPVEYIEAILDKRNIKSSFYGIGGNNLNDERGTKEKVIQYLFDKYPCIEADNSVMVGDRKYDILGAKAFSLLSVGVRYGYAAPNELENAGADCIVDSVQELKALIMAL